MGPGAEANQQRYGGDGAKADHFAPCLVGMTACGGANYRAREIAALGHQPFVSFTV
jgi:hypothetical protein